MIFYQEVILGLHSFKPLNKLGQSKGFSIKLGFKKKFVHGSKTKNGFRINRNICYRGGYYS